MALTADALEPLLRLSLVEGIGPARLAMLVERFGSAAAALDAREAELRGTAGIGAGLARRIRAASRTAAIRDTERAVRCLAALGAVALTFDDPQYPEPFRHLAGAPYLLFAVGGLQVLDNPAIAVVGTRSPTSYGRDAARHLSRDLALAGYTVVSGLARGIDTMAHLGAIEAGGATVAVLGHGIEQVYPPENRELFARVSKKGLLLTEYPPGETPKAGNFPRRNRLIAALAEAVLVVEMAHRSGAQHTVNFALEQGKEVMAVPGPINSQTSAGTNQLIKDGARMVTSVEDVVEELSGVGSTRRQRTALGHTDPAPASPEVAPSLSLLTAGEESVLQAISPSLIHIDELADLVGLATSEALATLLELELRGLVTSHPGKHFSRRG